MAGLPIGPTAENLSNPLDFLKSISSGNVYGFVKWKEEGDGMYIQDLRDAPEPPVPLWIKQPTGTTIYMLVANYGADKLQPPPPSEQVSTQSPTPGTNNQGGSPGGLPAESEVPTDPRLLFVVDEKSKSVIYSYTSAKGLTSPLVSQFVVKLDDDKTMTGGDDPAYTLDKARVQHKQLMGTPSLMNQSAYINFGAGMGEKGIQYLVERENQPRFYDVGAGFVSPDDSPKGELTVQSLIEWSKKDKNYKFPYKYQDFVFLKWWKKIPLNYMITLRRFKYPTIDSLMSAEEELDKVPKDTLLPVATAITFLGEDPGNKISSIIGNFDAGLKWKDVKADVWEVSYQGSPKDADTPFPFASKIINYLAGGGDQAKTQENPTPPDPYNNGPYENKILGPVTVIDSTKARERGINFKHDITLIFEYSARSIGSINSKAVMLDILGNLMVLTFNEAPFWGGMNRMMPTSQPNHEPFLGGPAGRAAFLSGNPEKFFEAIGDQLAKAAKNIGEAFNKFFQDPLSGLAAIADGAMTNYMKMKTSGGKGFLQGLHSLLTGAPVGEWHLTVGNPMNPMMMVGNLVCTGIKIEFNDELGPDDFPTELKATVTLEHGMPRDRAGIESMFNSGKGRLYSLPKGFEQSFSSVNASAVDAATKKGPAPVTAWATANPALTQKQSGSPGNAGAKTGNTQANSTENNKGRGKNPLLGDPGAAGRVAGYFAQRTVPAIMNVAGSVKQNGSAFFNRVVASVKK